MPAAAPGGYSMCYGRIRKDHPGANDIRYTSSIPRSFMVHTTPACAVTNSAADVSSSPRGKQAGACKPVGVVERYR